MGSIMAKDGTGKHAAGNNHQSGDKQDHRGKPKLTGKYEGRHAKEGKK